MYNVKDPRLQGMLHYEREGVFQVPFLLIYQRYEAPHFQALKGSLKGDTVRNPVYYPVSLQPLLPVDHRRMFFITQL